MALFKSRKTAPATDAGLVTTSLAFGALSHTYARLYREQPAVHTVVSFLARNIAQVPLHGYVKDSKGNRERLPDKNPLERLLHQPNAETSGYRFVYDLIADLAVNGNSYWLKVGDGKSVTALVRLPPGTTRPEQPFAQDRIVIKTSFANGTQTEYPREDVIHFRSYNSEGKLVGMSPLEACRAMLAEDYESTRARDRFWRNGAQYSDVFERPAEAGDWSEVGRKRFRDDIKARHSNDSTVSGFPLVLEEGMKHAGGGTSPRDAQYVAGRTLTLGFVGGVFGIPPQLIGASATDRNWSEAHRALYQDLLPPWTRLVEDEFQLQLLPEMFGEQADNGRIFCEFSLEEKLRGSFMQQAEVANLAVGGPFMTPNEWRKLQNMPPITGGDSLVTQPTSGNRDLA